MNVGFVPNVMFSEIVPMRQYDEAKLPTSLAQYVLVGAGNTLSPDLL
jgi:hypothetical protein